MKKVPFTLTFLLMLGLLTGCSLDHRFNSLEEASYRAKGFENNMNTAPIDPADHIEKRVEAIPGVKEAHVLFYGVDNLILGIDTEEPPSLQAIKGWIKQELQGEAVDFLIYVVTNRESDLLARVKAMRSNILEGQKVRESEMVRLVNGVWKTVVPFNLLSKS
ncbi:YhcN/YlaJ family sporulation lipoprotein [Ammoniphilus sp. CFH 90114]|uniref:YhcN/YlaJ family sporulation lipoprotein n=1 Tax=Ammoniphilus sp. CFH 90114 TaxID=2493665 RepID=UPI0013E992D9|nr:YhcN/YlaJ family sporulation lipoprotein [Ammoniphilus sp. CFH 90114]